MVLNLPNLAVRVGVFAFGGFTPGGRVGILGDIAGIDGEWTVKVGQEGIAEKSVGINSMHSKVDFLHNEKQDG